jgi:hypothetical protein
MRDSSLRVTSYIHKEAGESESIIGMSLQSESIVCSLQVHVHIME